jgi:signal transduction histidine kinase
VLHEFLTVYREPIITRTREKLTNRPWPVASTSELEHGVPLFLTQLSETLRTETGAARFPPNAIASAATLHGGELLSLGFTVSQVVHDYGDICQAIIEVIVEHNASITAQEFHVLNRCLDAAIAEAVTEHARVTAESRSMEEIERSGQLAHEIRDMLNTAVFAFEALKGHRRDRRKHRRGAGPQSLGLRALVDGTLSKTRMTANHLKARMGLGLLVPPISLSRPTSTPNIAECIFSAPVASELAISVDPQLLASAVMNLLNNALKYTRADGNIVPRIQKDRRLRIEVEDECGGIPESRGDPFQPSQTDGAMIGPGSALGRRLPEKPSERTAEISVFGTYLVKDASSSLTFRWPEKRRLHRWRSCSVGPHARIGSDGRLTRKAHHHHRDRRRHEGWGRVRQQYQRLRGSD